MNDLLTLLKGLLRAEVLPLESSIEAVLTALRVVNTSGEELVVDEKEFVNILYKVCSTTVHTVDICIYY